MCSPFGIWFSFIFRHLSPRPIQFISLHFFFFFSPALTGSALSTAPWQNNAQNASHVLKRYEYTRKCQWISVVSCYCQNDMMLKYNIDAMWIVRVVVIVSWFVQLLLLLLLLSYSCADLMPCMCLSWSFVVLWGFDIVIWILVSYLSCSSMLSAWIIYLSFMPACVDGLVEKRKWKKIEFISLNTLPNKGEIPRAEKRC